ncbi:hypothetical protein [Halorubrum trueperi]|uniref:Uncharacterized protein n=1 Tax=Halorubrum trueperi TaxID=2004704 RepID=A0ABD5US04_9EURY
MELSRRGVLGGIGSAFAIGAIGFVGAVTVSDDADGGTEAGGDGTVDGAGTGEDGAGAGEDGGGDGSVAADPDAPFAARLLDGSGADGEDGDDADSRDLFDAGDLSRVQGVVSEDGEHLVYVALGDGAIETVQERLAESGAVDDPDRFVVSMSLDGTEVRRVEFDEERVAALTDDEWGGVLTLPFGQESVAADVYESLAAS